MLKVLSELAQHFNRYEKEMIIKMTKAFIEWQDAINKKMAFSSILSNRRSSC